MIPYTRTALRPYDNDTKHIKRYGASQFRFILISQYRYTRTSIRVAAGFTENQFHLFLYKKLCFSVLVSFRLTYNKILS